MENINKENILLALKNKKYKIEDRMIIGVRTDYTNHFTDYIILIDNINNVFKKYKATTVAGETYLYNPINPKNGTAILIEGNHLNAFKLGKHQGKYDALVQAKALPIFRDNNKNNVPDLNGLITNELIGLNIHHAGSNSVNVDKYSAGCQVIANIQDWIEFYAIVKYWNLKYYSYILINKKDIK